MDITLDRFGLSPNRRQKGRTLTALLRRLFGRRNQQETERPPALAGIRGGVSLREPNGSAHPIQNLVEQALAKQGMALFNLCREPVERLLKAGEWSDEIAGGNLLDLAVIGQVVVREVGTVRNEYPSRRHTHTPTGKFFSDLSADHPDYRTVYSEPKIMFDARREAEKRVVKAQVNQCTLDARFYGPDGRIHGAVIASSHLEDNDPSGTLANWLVGELGKVAKRSLAAHSRSRAELELFGPDHLP